MTTGGPALCSIGVRDRGAVIRTQNNQNIFDIASLSEVKSGVVFVPKEHNWLPPSVDHKNRKIFLLVCFPQTQNIKGSKVSFLDRKLKFYFETETSNKRWKSSSHSLFTDSCWQTLPFSPYPLTLLSNGSFNKRLQHVWLISEHLGSNITRTKSGGGSPGIPKPLPHFLSPDFSRWCLISLSDPKHSFDRSGTPFHKPGWSFFMIPF